MDSAVINQWLWAASNLTILYIFVAGILFLAAYTILFNPSLTTAGKFIWRTVLSLIVLTFLDFLRVYVDPARPWYEMRDDMAEWRPAATFAINVFVAYNFTMLAAFVIRRRFKPARVKTAPVGYWTTVLEKRTRRPYN